MRRAVLVSRIFAPEPAAASFRLAALTRALAAAGTHVTVLTTQARPGSPEPDDAALGARVHRARVLRDAFGYVRGYLPYLSFDLPTAWRLFRVLGGLRPQVVVVEPPPTTGLVVRLVCALRGVPYVYYAADVWSDATRGTGAPGLVARVLERLEAWAWLGARGVLAVTEGVAARVRELAPDAEVAVVRNGVDTEVFRPGLPRPEGAPERYLLYAGTASEWQGAEVFVRALPALRRSRPEVELVFLGSGSAWRSLEELARQVAPGAVRFVPQVPPEEAARWQANALAACVSIVPGIGYDFALPTKLFAAVASGTPVVFAGPEALAAHVVREGRLGRAVGHEPEAVAAALAEFVEGPVPQERQRLAAWAREHASLAATGREAAAHVSRWSDPAEEALD